MSDQMPGGLGDKRTPKDFDPGALRQGMEVEMEHTDDPRLAREIAMDHLTEDPRYYERLAVLEQAVQRRGDDSRTFVVGEDPMGVLADAALALLDRQDTALATEALRLMSEV